MAVQVQVTGAPDTRVQIWVPVSVPPVALSVPV